MSELDCQAIFELLSQYLDRELPAATCDELERHIRNCPPCIEFVESLRRSVNLCRQYDSADDAPALPSSVKQSLRKAYEDMLAARRKANDFSDPA